MNTSQTNPWTVRLLLAVLAVHSVSATLCCHTKTIGEPNLVLCEAPYPVVRSTDDPILFDAVAIGAVATPHSNVVPVTVDGIATSGTLVTPLDAGRTICCGTPPPPLRTIDGGDPLPCQSIVTVLETDGRVAETALRLSMQ